MKMRQGAGVVKAVASAVVLVALLVGVPVVLWMVAGSPVPHGLPSMVQVKSTFAAPDYTGTVMVGTLKVVGWVAWATFAWATVAELVAQVRHRSAPRLRGLGFQQQVAAALVGAVLVGFVWQAAASSPSRAAVPAPPAPVVAAALVEEPSGLVDQHLAAPEQAPAGATTTHTVVKGDTLWGLATQYLGDGTRWREIYDINSGREMPDGHILSDPGWLDPGWELVVPDERADVPTAPEHTRTVQRGDTLWQIAEDELGDPTRYPEIYAASTGTAQPDGRHLVDPDLIYPGWQVTIPGAQAPADASDPQAPAPPQDTTAQPGTDGQAQPGDVSTGAEPGTVVPGQPSAQQQTQSQQSAGHERGIDQWAPWVLAGLACGGAVLAGSLWLVLQARRRARQRHRLPGQALPTHDPLLAPVAKTVATFGAGAAHQVTYLDEVLRRLGAAVATTGETMPDLVAVELTGTHVVLHLGSPWEMGEPWEGADEGHVWRIEVGTDLDLVGPPGEHPAPYPLLVTVGAGHDGALWLLNTEDVAITLTGEPERARDFGRYLVAEISCSPWAAWTNVECVGLGAELVGLNPDRIRYHHVGTATDPVGDVLAEALTTVARTSAAGTDVVTARSAELGVQSWAPRVVLVDATNDDPALEPLLETIAQYVGQTATSVVLAGPRTDSPGGVHIEVTAEGRVLLPEVGLDLVAVGLDITEAGGCAALAAHTDTATGPVPVPYHETDTGWRGWCDLAGSLRSEHTVPRDPDSWCDMDDPPSVLPDDDEHYMRTAAVTAEELDLLGPQVTNEVRQGVEATDPHLDDDLTAWLDPSCPRPKIRVLGPVQVAATGTAPARRSAFFTELLTYLALHPDGVTGAQIAAAFSTSRGKAREYLRTIHTWVGTDPATDEPYLWEPDDTRDPVCYLDALVDLDLLRRLRLRGQARGADGIHDLLTGLQLVAGPPFGDPTTWRPGGWSWLVDEQHDDTALIAALDTAHTVITHTLATADYPTARMAASMAQLADPNAEIINLDLAAIASGERRQAEAARIVADDIGNRSDDGHAPPELPTRTQQIITTHPTWLTHAS
ncbi:MAG: LysM peptidoglycan-binding domain-containing protein [Micrococcales bacterium]|nr:LysM peptidoglycan-binding domain-containing protein [Micrococcales bacterium]